MEQGQSNATDHDHPEDETDHDLCDQGIGEDEMTDDTDLPAAEGGVEEG